MTPGSLLGVEELPRALAEVTETLAAVDLDRAVPGCPGWDARDLAGHLSTIHQWAAAAVRAGDPDAGPPSATPEPVPPAPAGARTVAQWYDRHAVALVTALRRAGPDAPAWGFGPRPRTSGFWWRRMLHETRLHHWDLGPGDAPVHGDPALALDGIDEVVTVFVPRQLRLGRLDALPGGVRLVPDEVGDGSGWALGDEVAATLRGPADALLLALWGRTGVDDARVRVTGDVSLAAEVLSRPLVP